jgi:hypothetical protein
LISPKPGHEGHVPLNIGEPPREYLKRHHRPQGQLSQPRERR